MRTYWDLSEAERAKLTREQVESFIDVELMTRGVLKVPPLVLEDVPETVKPTKTYFRIRRNDHRGDLDVVFETIEQARDFLALNPMTAGSIWLGNEAVHHAEDRVDFSIYEATMLSNAEANVHRARLQAAAEAKRRNETATREHDKAINEQQKALAEMWSDWNERRAELAKLQRVIDTFADYKKVAGGDQDIAARFLRKAFPVDIIEEAERWFDIKVPAVELDAIEALPNHKAPASASDDIAF